jgi:hypothetical protein
MLGIVCFGEAHEQRVRGIIERLTPEVYLLLTEAKKIACSAIECKAEKHYNAPQERDFIERTNDVLGTFPKYEEGGEPRTVYIDIQYSAEVEKYNAKNERY